MGGLIKSAGTLAGAGAAVLLAACQPALDPVMPAGSAGYEALAASAGPGAEEAAGPYQLGAGDTIAVRVYEEPELTVEEIALDNGGVVSLPLIGDVAAAGLTATQLARTIEDAYRANYLRDPRVSVIIREGRERTIAVEGEVEQPGVFPFVEGQTLLSALALARSPTETAKLDEVMVFRTIGANRQAARFDVQAIRGGRAPDLALQPGDLVVVGYSSLRGAYQDFVRAIPVLGIFRPY